MKKDSKNELFWFLIVSLLLSLMMFFSYFSKDDDIEYTTLKGFFKEYKKIDSRKGKDFYMLYLESGEYSIPDIYISSFNKKDFLDHVKKGDLITLSIEGNKTIHQIKKDNINYIDVKKREDLSNNNSFFGFILGIVFLCITVFLFFVYKKAKN